MPRIPEDCFDSSALMGIRLEIMNAEQMSVPNASVQGVCRSAAVVEEEGCKLDEQG